MIVYGDPSVQESFRSRVRRLRESLSVASPASLDARRRLLIEAGMLEQAVEDALGGTWAARCRDLTDACAEAFLGGTANEDPLARLADAPDVPLDVKFPEGFAFYALYPEGYAAATERWRGDHPDSGGVLVVGVRSIGTTLSAVVAATLRAHGVPVRRLTVRPTGHPFGRETTLDPHDLHGVDALLVVDEGPGLSGSSMASVAEAAQRAGLPPDRVAFLPGHGNPPGPHASEAVRARWASTPRYATPTEGLRWDGRTLEETLADRTAPPDEVARVEELTGGRWRALAYGDEADWPAIDAPFERRKLLVTRKDGPATLWKFVGFAEPGTTLGFLPTPWLEGRPLARHDLDPAVLHALARHLAATAGPPLPEDEARAARDRLARMRETNAREAGESVPFAVPRDETGPSALDDRLAPPEWRRLPDGGIVKVPRPFGLLDHTVVGRPPFEWAVAAAIVEWGMDEAWVARLRKALPTIDPAALAFHRTAYAAFRLGMTLHGAAEADPAECARLGEAERLYRAALRQAAGAEGRPST